MSDFSPYMPLVFMLMALITDAVLGWPGGLFKLVGHPVTWFGRWISFADKALNNGSETRRFALGMAASLALLLVVGAVTLALQIWLLQYPWGFAVLALLAWPFLAIRSMYDHVAAVLSPLQQGDLPAARQAVAMIVGRDVTALDESGVSRAALESLAENTGDGIIAPLFWGLVAGLPGIAVYKVINTLDSMIGYRNDDYEYFGKFAARLDDVVNWIPARLTGCLFILASLSRHALMILRLDAGRHRSPNAGWPEAALAGALDIRLSGPRQYGDRVEHEPWINQTGKDAGPEAIKAGLALYRRMLILVAVLMITGMAI